MAKKYQRVNDRKVEQIYPVQILAVGHSGHADPTTPGVGLTFVLACGCGSPNCEGKTLSPMVLKTRTLAAEMVVALRTQAEEIWPGFVAALDQEATAFNNDTREA